MWEVTTQLSHFIGHHSGPSELQYEYDTHLHSVIYHILHAVFSSPLTLSHTYIAEIRSYLCCITYSWEQTWRMVMAHDAG